MEEVTGYGLEEGLLATCRHGKDQAGISEEALVGGYLAIHGTMLLLTIHHILEPLILGTFRTTLIPTIGGEH